MHVIYYRNPHIHLHVILISYLLRIRKYINLYNVHVAHTESCRKECSICMIWKEASLSFIISFITHVKLIKGSLQSTDWLK